MEENKHVKILRRQLRGEITEAEVYRRLAAMEKSAVNRELLERISHDEECHAGIISNILGETARPDRFAVARIIFNARLFGLTFALKMMERGEFNALRAYRSVADAYPELAEIARDEEVHEKALIDMLDDERLNNMGSIVLGLNDALVELTGALAGFTLALSDPVRIAKTGLITGLAAAMSMSASAFLSARAGDAGRGAGKAAVYTGVAYVMTVLLLVAPYFFLPSATYALVAMLLAAFGIIAFFNFYLSVARETSFKRGFFEMAGISTVVAIISFGIGYLLR